MKILPTFFKKNLANIFAIFFATVYAFIFSYYSILRHANFYSGYDLSNFDHTLWNTVNNRFFQLITNDVYVSRLAIHADFILIPISFLYLLWNDVRLILILQSMILALAGVGVFLLAKHVLKNTMWAVILALSFYLTPAIEWANLYDFHPPTIAAAALIFAIYFFEAKKNLAGIICLVIAALCKESTPVTVALIGIWLFVFKKEKKLGGGIFVVSSIYFLVIILWAIPSVSLNREHWALTGYLNAQKEDVYGSKMTSLAFYPFRILFDPMTIDYYKNLIKGIGPWLLFSPETLFIILPSLLKNVVADNGVMRGIFEHYSVVPMVVLFVATIFGIKNLFLTLDKRPQIFKIYKITQIKTLVIMSVFILSLRSFFLMSPLPVNSQTDQNVFQTTEDSIKLQKFLDESIPKDAKVSASPEIRSHLTHREIIYPFPWRVNEVDYLIFTTHNRIFFDHLQKEFETKLLKDLKQNKAYSQIFHSGDYFIYKKL